MDFNPNGLNIASTSFDKSVKIWDLRKGDLIYTLSGHNGCTSSVAFSKNGEYFSTGAQDSLVILWKSGSLSKKIDYKNTLNQFPSQFLKNDPLNNPVQIDINKKSADNLSEELSKFFEKMVIQMEILTKTLQNFDGRLNKVENMIENIKKFDGKIDKNDMINRLGGLKQEYNEIYNQVNNLKNLNK